MFTVGETRTISVGNEREEQTQQRWIQQVGGNPRLRRFSTETPPEREGDLKFSAGKEEEDDEKKPHR